MASPANLMNFKSPLEPPSKDIFSSQSPGCDPTNDFLKKAENNSDSFEFTISPFNDQNTSFKDRLSLAPLDLNTSDFLARESLGILPSTALGRDSLLNGFLNISHSTAALETPMLSPRESLGVLDISAMDFGRESIGIFSIKQSFLGRKSVGNEHEDNLSFNVEDFNFGNIENGLRSLKESPVLTGNLVPELMLSTSTTQEKLNTFSLSGLNQGFLFPHSKILSTLSSGSSSVSVNPSFDSRSLEELSKIFPNNYSTKDIGTSLLADPFNEAFQIPNSADNSIHSMSQILTSTSTKKSFASDIECVRNRIQSLPVTFEDNSKILADIDLDDKVLNFSFQDAMVCRGVEDEKEFDDSVFLEARKVASMIADTSFVGDEQSFESKGNNILDATPQPEWPEELDSSGSNIEGKLKSPKCDKDTILKQVDKMLGMQPVNLDERLKLKNAIKNDSPSPENISQNLSKISRLSQNSNQDNCESCVSNNFTQNLSKISGSSPEGDAAGNQNRTSNNFSQNISKISAASNGSQPVNRSSASNNFSQNLSRITQTSDANVSKLIQNLSDILNENENLSQSQKHEGRHLLDCLADLLTNSKNKALCSEDSGHSSVEDQPLEENKSRKNPVVKDPKIVNCAGSSNSEEICHALDLSCKSKSSSSESNKRMSMSKSAAAVNPESCLLKTSNHVIGINTSSASVASNSSDINRNASKANNSSASTHSNASSVRSGNLSSASTGRHSNASQNRISLSTAKLRKSKVGIVATKKGPLRAVLPVENMAKVPRIVATGVEGPVTPEKNNGGLKFGLRSKKTSTPIQEPKLKPMAASTPAARQSKVSKENIVSPLPSPSYNRSFSYQPKTSSTLGQPGNVNKSRESISSITKSSVNKSQSKAEGTKLVRRNSVTEGSLGAQIDSEGHPMRIKRSFSTGKEPKILSALTKVRQNILNSPYYNPRKSLGAGQGDQKIDALSENARKTGTDLKGCGQELKRLSMISQPKKPGKENLKP